MVQLHVIAVYFLLNDRLSCNTLTLRWFVGVLVLPAGGGFPVSFKVIYSLFISSYLCKRQSVQLLFYKHTSRVGLGARSIPV